MVSNNNAKKKNKNKIGYLLNRHAAELQDEVRKREGKKSA